MGIESPIHLIFIGIVALLVLGPRRLPELARRLGEGMRELRESIDAGAEHHDTPEQPPDGAPAATPEDATPHNDTPAAPAPLATPPAASPAAPGTTAAAPPPSGSGEAPP